MMPGPPPAARGQYVQPQAAPGFGYWNPLQPLGGFGIATSILIGICAVLDMILVVRLLIHAGTYDAIGEGDVWAVERYGVDDSLRTAVIMFGIAYLVTAAVFIAWLYRAAANSEVWEMQRPTLSSGWAVGGWFLPLANYVIPGAVTAGVWRRSDPRAMVPGMHRRSTAAVWAWWSSFIASWLVMGVVLYEIDNVTDAERADDKGGSGYDGSAADFANPDYVDAVVRADMYGALSGVLRIVAAVLAVMVVQTITNMQNQRMGIGRGMPPMAYAPGGLPPGMPPGMSPGSPPGMPTGMHGPGSPPQSGGGSPRRPPDPPSYPPDVTGTGWPSAGPPSGPGPGSGPG